MNNIEKKKRKARKRIFNPKAEYRLIPNFGWKKNLLAIVVSVLICFLLNRFSLLTSSVRGISEFDLANALLPLLSFSMGIWLAIGYLIYYLYMLASSLLSSPQELSFILSVYVPVFLATVVYCLLPTFLWYSIRLKGEEKAEYPRLDTSAHVIKFYLIMFASICVYLILEILPMFRYSDNNTALDLAFWFMQYLDTILIVGIPFLIIVSLIRNLTLTINERLMLAFLVVGVIAASMGAYFVYRNTLALEPSLFEDYEQLFAAEIASVKEDAASAAYERYNAYWNRFYVMTAIMLNSLLIIEIAFMYSIEKKVTKPLLRLAGVLEQYAQPESSDEDEANDSSEESAGREEAAGRKEPSDGTGPPDGMLDGTGRLNPEAVRESCRPYRYGYGEISSLTRTCVDMVGRIDTYTKNLRQVTADKERIGAELDVASKIQKDMLPGVFPPFPDRSEFELYASMTPAKEVGGDFYDFYFIDNDRLALTIADVSGKGVPASLFMVISKTLLKNQSQTGLSPKEILTYVNHQLCQNNETMMFCTVWLGILDLRTGKLTASNGGHEYPAIRRNGGSYELVKYRHDPALGIIDGLRYKEYELTLNPGDCIFVYTDGVPEAENAVDEQLGEDRMVEALNGDPGASPEQLIGNIHEAIHAFVKEEPQFDDITMLSLQYLGTAGTHKGIHEQITVPAAVDSLDKVTQFITEHLEAAGCPEETLFAISLATEELFVNIAKYAYEGKDKGDAGITFSFDEKERLAEITFTDSGLPFDPTARQDPDITLAPGDRQIGGLGIHIVKRTMDEVAYSYTGGKNRLTIRKHI